MNKIIVKTVCKFLIAIFILGFLLILGYIVYVSSQYYRINDLKLLEINNNSSKVLGIDGSYHIATYNTGFGAKDADFSFFMESGMMKENNVKTHGRNTKAKNKETVEINLNGMINVLNQQELDFILLQEVDLTSKRSCYVNQQLFFSNAYANFGSTNAINYHTANLLYPFYSTYGKNSSGILTLSKYKINDAVRYSLPINENFPAKFLKMDACFSKQVISLSNGNNLTIINLHLSAFSKNENIVQLQLDRLNEVLTEEKSKGNYVIVGGDFNMDIANSKSFFSTKQYFPDWVFQLSTKNIPKGYKLANANNAPTRRSGDIPYEKNVNYTIVQDGFLVSDNIQVYNVTNIDTNFKYSNHNPVVMEFGFKQ